MGGALVRAVGEFPFFLSLQKCFLQYRDIHLLETIKDNYPYSCKRSAELLLAYD
jgi:hypothetical protein